MLPQQSDASSVQRQAIAEPKSRGQKLLWKTAQLLYSKSSPTSPATKASPQEIRDQSISKVSLTVPSSSAESPQGTLGQHGSAQVDATCTLSAFPPPYLIGFNHSRPNTINAFTEGPPKVPGEEDYQHPRYATDQSRQRFKLGYEYYSVGLVLLEIGLWKPLSVLIGGNIEDYSLAEQQMFWRQEAVPLLGPSMGSIYRDAVSACLSD